MPAKFRLYGAVGSWYDSNRAKDVIDFLDEREDGEDVVMHINSPGGSAWEGTAIFQALSDYEGKVTIRVDALAASAASIVAMAGDEVIMGEASMMMVHSPWLLTMGNAEQLRKDADVLDKVQTAMIAAYMRQTDKTEDELNDLLDAETWFSAQEAVDEGFATDVDSQEDDDANAMAAVAEFDLSDFNDIPDRLRERVAAAAQMRTGPAVAMASTQTKGNDMPTEKTQTTANATSQPEGAGEDASTIDLDAERDKAQQAATERAAEIVNLCEKVGLQAKAGEFIASDKDLGDIRAEVIDLIAERDDKANVNVDGGVVVGEDEGKKRADAAEKALLMRAGQEDFDRNNPYIGMTLMEMGAEFAQRRGVELTGNRVERAGAILNPRAAAGGHTTADFPKILENVARKELMRGYEEAPETFQRFTRRGSLPDFKPMSRVNLNLFDELDEVDDVGEYQYGTVSERDQTIQLAKYGKLFRISRETLINDDLDAFSRIPAGHGRAAARTVGNLVFALLTTNHEMDDGTDLFSSGTHGNKATSADLAVSTLDAGRVAMATQKDPDDKADGGLNIEPAFLIVPQALKGTARQLIESTNDPSSDAADGAVNIVGGMAEIIADARLDADSAVTWYLAADPMLFDTIEVAYLNGMSTPFLDSKDGWSVDGREYKVRLEAGVDVLDYRGLYQGVGS